MSTYTSLEPKQRHLLSPQLELHRLPVLSEFEALVNSFNTRNLTYEDDVLIAFAGVATRLSEKFKGGLLSGLPELFFDICLLWRPLRRTQNPSRRRTGLLPSWSWAGWENEVTWPYTWNYTSDFAGPIPIMLGNTRPFYQIQMSYTITDQLSVPIGASWSDDATKIIEQGAVPEWRSSSLDTSTLQEWGLPPGEVFFKHVSEENIRFCFPVSLSTSLTLSHIPNLLNFRTTAGTFKLGEVRRSVTRIHTMQGAPAGVLWQHDENDDDFLSATAGPIDDRSSIELIAILGCTILRESNPFWEMPDVFVLGELNTFDVGGRN